MTHPYATLDDRRIIRDANHGRVRRTDTGVDIHQRPGTVAPVRVDLTKHRTAGWLHLVDGTYRPTMAGLSIAGIATEATR
jgi:hypothetical protein